jgi:hypothetical protein
MKVILPLEQPKHRPYSRILPIWAWGELLMMLCIWTSSWSQTLLRRQIWQLIRGQLAMPIIKLVLIPTSWIALWLDHLLHSCHWTVIIRSKQLMLIFMMGPHRSKKEIVSLQLGKLLVKSQSMSLKETNYICSRINQWTVWKKLKNHYSLMMIYSSRALPRRD